MLIQSGNVRALNQLPWVGMELASDARTDEIVLHLIRWAVRELQNEPFQILFPIKARGLEGPTLLSPCIWMRVKTVNRLNRIKPIFGLSLVVGPNEKAIQVEDGFVQGLILQARQCRQAWSRGISEGSRVRVLVGRQRMLCGEVVKLKGEVANVLIALRSRNVRLTVPVGALQKLETDAKEYFYKES